MTAMMMVMAVMVMVMAVMVMVMAVMVMVTMVKYLCDGMCISDFKTFNGFG